MQHRFSIIAYFDEETTNEIRHIQSLLLAETGSHGSLTSWLPHVTVGSGIVVEEEQLGDLYNTIGAYLDTMPPTIITTNDFGYMDNWSGAKLGHTPYVIYIKPDALGALPEIATFFEGLKSTYRAWYDQPWPYQPHITVAFKDLNKEGFARAQKFLSGKTYKKHIRIDSISLAERDDRGVWTECKRFFMKG